MQEASILKEYTIVAVVGLSTKPNRPSHRVAKYLISKGYKVIPVNPDAQEILGKKSYTNLSSIPEPIEIVDIFRRSEEVMPIVDEKAASIAGNAGLQVVMNRCMLKEHMRLSKKQD